MSARKYKKGTPWRAKKRNETLTSSTLSTILDGSMNFDGRSSSMPASSKSKKSSSSIGVSKTSKRLSSSTSALKKSKTSSTSKNSSEKDMFEGANSDSDSDDWSTLNAKTILCEEQKLISEKSMNENSEYSLKSPERIREALAPIADIYNPNESFPGVDENFGISKSQKNHYINDEYYPAKSTTKFETTKVASVEAPIVTEQLSDLEDLSDTSSGSLHVLHEENRKTYLAPTEDPTWNERWYDTRKKISPRRQKFPRKTTLEDILEIGRKPIINVKPEEIKFHEARLRVANELWDDFIAKQPANPAASCSTAPKRKFFKKKAIDNGSKRAKNDEYGTFTPHVSPCPPGMTCVRRKFIDTDSDSDSGILSYEWRVRRMLKIRRRNATKETIASTYKPPEKFVRGELKSKVRSLFC